MDTDLSGLLLRVLIYGSIIILLNALLRRPLTSASLAFWFAWACLMFGGIVAESYGWRSIDTFSAPYLIHLFNGAFFGFALVTLVPIKRASETHYLQVVTSAERILDRLKGKVMFIAFLVGVIFLAERIAVVGLSTDYLNNVRGVYNQREGNQLAQISSHLMVFLTLLVILRGLVDSHRGVNLKALIVVILVAAPFGLAQGARIFLFSFLIAYFTSLLLTRSRFSRAKGLLSWQEGIGLGSLGGYFC